ncbi:MAG: flagellar basal body rod protein FlgB [Candidatus Eisenbacteria sp.]|nr:flagellar basal body rod protein FlgB [Candidatus Eisenbacteria bacterium]
MVREVLFGGQSWALLRRGLDAGAARMKATAQNVAHAGTPGYGAQRVEFEELLGNAQARGVGLAQTHPAHLASHREPGSLPRPRVVPTRDPVPEGATNNVDVERELVVMQKNEIHFQALSQVLADKYRGLRDVIRPS